MGAVEEMMCDVYVNDTTGNSADGCDLFFLSWQGCDK